MKRLLFFLFSYFWITNIYSQIELVAPISVGTDTPHSSTSFDLKNATKGILLPHISTVNRNLIANPAVGLLIYNTDESCFQQNIGTESIPLWKCLLNDKPSLKSFYMPSIAIDTSTLGNGQTLDLFTTYKNQFQNPTIKSSGAPVAIPFYTSATDLYYYVTYYDPTVFANISISVNGIMTYDVLTSASGCSFITIVFVPKY